MEENLRIIKKEFENLKGQHVIIDNIVLRFIAIAEDEWDFIYIMWNGKKLISHTVLEGIIPLKGKIDDKYYERIVRGARWNHHDSLDYMCPRTEDVKEAVKNFSKEVKQEAEEELKDREKLKLLSEICWDFN